MIQFMIVLLMLLIGHTLASAQTPTRVMSGYAATSGPLQWTRSGSRASRATIPPVAARAMRS